MLSLYDSNINTGEQLEDELLAFQTGFDQTYAREDREANEVVAVTDYNGSWWRTDRGFISKTYTQIL